MRFATSELATDHEFALVPVPVVSVVPVPVVSLVPAPVVLDEDCVK
jgi:hypothetical protein